MPAHAAPGDNLTCHFFGTFVRQSTWYSMETNPVFGPATCAGLVDGQPFVTFSTTIVSTGTASGDPCTAATFGDADGSTTSAGDNSWEAHGLAFTAVASGGRAELVFAGGDWVGAGTVEFFTEHDPPVCSPIGGDGYYWFEASFNVEAASSPPVNTQTPSVCVFTGLSGSLTPDIQSIESDLLALTPLDVERGDYNFSTGAPLNTACAGEFNGNPRVEQSGTIVSHGSYDNILCGTGFAHDLDGDGTAVSFASGNGIGGSADPIGYEIPFIAGQGPMLIGPKGDRPSLVQLATGNPLLTSTDTVNSGPQQDPFRRPVGGNYTGVGFVNIVPVNLPGGCQSQPVDQFTVTGFFIVEDVL